MRPLILIPLYLLVLFMPLALALADGKPPRTFWDEIASGAGLLAYSILLMEFVLSGRFRVISGRIGMDVTMRFHQLLARTALVLAALHPFLYRSPFAPQRPWDVSGQLTLSDNFVALGTGALAFAILPGLVLIAIGRDQLGMKYETWRFMHGISALALAGLLFHHASYSGRYSGEPGLTLFWAILSGLALASLLYVYLVTPLSQSRKPWTVDSVKKVGLKTWQLKLSPLGHSGLDYSAGQFAWINIGHSPFLLAENPFSISSAPGDGPQISFLIKELGDFTKTVGSIQPGTKAYLDGPYGTLTLGSRRAAGFGLIAGGVGVAPLLSILRQLHHDGDERPTTLVYGNRVEEQILLAEEFDRLAEDHGTKIVHVLSEPPKGWTGPVGMVEADLIRTAFDQPGAHEWLYLICGPPAMMETVEDTLMEIGVPSSQIIPERFKYD